MPNKSHIILIFLLAGISCKKDFEKINTDPNQITSGQINYNYLFSLKALYIVSLPSCYCCQNYRFQCHLLQVGTI